MLIMDSREKSTSPTIFNALTKLVGSENIKVENMPVDYRVAGEKGEYYIERKTANDFVNSWKTGRIFEQFETLSVLQENGAKSILLIEGSLHIPVKYGKWTKEGVMGLLTSTVCSWSFKTAIVPSMQYTILFLRSLHNMVGKLEKKLHPIEFKPKALTLDEQARRVIEALPNIGPNIADKLLKSFCSIKRVMESVDDWDLVPGVGVKIKEEAKKVLEHKYGGGVNE